jgi:teichuronic acid biosynthesis glycosyltransferase TuaH
MKILLLAHTYYGSPFKVGSHFLFEEFRISNHEVRHMSTPITPFHRILRVFNRNKSKIQSARFATQDSALGHVIPRTFIPIQMRISGLFIPKNFKAELSQKVDLIIIDQVNFLRFSKFFYPEAQVILRLTDFVSKKREIDLIQKGIFHKIVVTNQHILKNLNNFDIPTIVIPNGYPSVKIISSSPVFKRHGMIYVGSLDSRIDWPLIQNIAAHSKFEFLHLYGLPKPKTALPDRVSYLGTIPHGDTFKLYEQYRFGLLPYQFSSQNICRSPMKLYEYIASGLIVLTPDFLKNEQYSEKESISTFASWIQDDLESRDYSTRSVTNDELGSTWGVISQQLLHFSLQDDFEIFGDAL